MKIVFFIFIHINSFVMKPLLLGVFSLFTFALFSQSIKVDSKEYQTLKSQGLIINQSLINLMNPINPNIHYAGKATKSGVCDCLIPLDSTFMLAMAPNDDLYSNSIYLPFSFNFYGTTYDSLYINNNGNISFTMPYNTFTAFSFPDPSFNMIAPFWADVDTRSTNGGNVWYKLNPHSLNCLGSCWLFQHDGRQIKYLSINHFGWTRHYRSCWKQRVLMLWRHAMDNGFSFWRN